MSHPWHEFLCRGEGIDDDGHVNPAATVEPTPDDEKNSSIDATDELLASRREVYGDRVSNMERTAALWSALLGFTIEDWQVPLMMSAYKMLRTFETPDYSDNTDDIDGWKKMFVEVMEANHGGIIQARTVEEYQRIKNENHLRETVGEALLEEQLKESVKPRHPYENVQRDEDQDPRWNCGVRVMNGWCSLPIGHFEAHRS